MTCCRWDHSYLKAESHLWVAALLTFSCTGKVRNMQWVIYVLTCFLLSICEGASGNFCNIKLSIMTYLTKKGTKIQKKSDCQFSGRLNTVQRSRIMSLKCTFFAWPSLQKFFVKISQKNALCDVTNSVETLPACGNSLKHIGSMIRNPLMPTLLGG